ncbi:PMCA [Cordylochernes scorpioides]|uniref:PMCA n=1 Tax=Cordylochernes scorpioides TaxID=51811 RepID=A0ABY6JZI7_9ARAC|nr:PMCA [Cordylochernes scorpioides]
MAASSTADGSRQIQYGMSVKELQALMECRGSEAVERIRRDYGGIHGICTRLYTSPTDGSKHTASNQLSRQLYCTGLSGSLADLEHRREKFGPNVIPPRPPKTFLQLVWEALQDLTLGILVVAAVISLLLAFYDSSSLPEPSHKGGSYVLVSIIQIVLYQNREIMDLGAARRPPPPGAAQGGGHEETGWIEGVAILASVVIVVLVTAFNDYSKEKQFRGLQSQIEHEHRFAVIRAGELQQISVSDLVVGDICQIKYGTYHIHTSYWPAECRDGCRRGPATSGWSSYPEQRPQTGRKLADWRVRPCQEGRGRRPSAALSPTCGVTGTHVMEGSGKMLVTAVGVNSQTGIIFALLGAAKSEDEAKKKLEAKGSSPLIALCYLMDASFVRTSVGI